jgi:hypothetical protein
VIALRRSYCDDCSHSCFIIIIRMLFLSVVFPVVVLVLGRSQVIALRGSYNDGLQEATY